MNKKVVKAIRSDCHRQMWPCYISGGIGKVMTFLVPTLAAWLVGDMADALLALDLAAIRGRLLPFMIALILEAVVLPLWRMLDSLLLVRRGGSYLTFLMERLLRRPLSALHGETGATVAKHVMNHAPAYYFIQICKFTLPVTCLVYGAALFVMLLKGALPLGFAFAVFLLAAVPLLRTVTVGKWKAKMDAGEKAYETNRAREEEALFRARSFFRVNRLTEHCLTDFHDRFEGWYSLFGKGKSQAAAAQVVFDYVCSYGTVLGVIFVGAVLVLANRMSVGSLMTGYLLLPTLTAFYSAVSDQLEEIQKEQDSQLRLTVFYGGTEEELSDIERELPPDSPAAEQICLEHVTFSYPGGDRPVLTDWSGVFSVWDKLWITGENGSGKTTLVRLLSGLYVPETGAITDENGSPLSREKLRRLVTIQEQDGYIFQGTVWENLFIGEDQRRQAQELLKSLGFEKQLDEPVAAGAANLSPGEQKKILLARALLRDTGFLILDEPLNHLDAAGGETLLSHLQKRQSGLLLISHQELPLSGINILALSPQSPTL